MSISTLSLSNSTRTTLTRLQTNLKDASTEMSTYRHADVGLTLGRLTGTAVSYRVQETSIDAQLMTNKDVASRLDVADDVMDAVAKSGESLSASLLAAGRDVDYAGLARSALQQMQGSMNTPVNGLYVFGGQNAATPPIKDVDTGIAAAKTAFTAFLARVKTETGSPIDITPATVPADALQKFLTTGYPTATAIPAPVKFSDTVGDAAWAANWSTSSGTTTAAITKSETIETSVSANETAFRDVASAFSMLAAISSTDLNADARSVLTKQAYSVLKTGTDGITTLRANLGARKARVETADTALDQQKTIVNLAFTRLEGVDETEAGLRVKMLETQLETSYAVTGRLQKLSLLDYL